MAKTAGLKHDRVHLRMDAGTKRQLERAAAYEEMTVSRFVLANAVAAARACHRVAGEDRPFCNGLGSFPQRADQPAQAERYVEEGGAPLSRAR